jgi:hypothetical protein
VGIVETDQPFIVLPVKSQRIIQPVRSFLRNWHLPHFEFHPMLTSFIDNQYLAVQIEESVQTWIALRPILHLL